MWTNRAFYRKNSSLIHIVSVSVNLALVSYFMHFLLYQVGVPWLSSWSWDALVPKYPKHLALCKEYASRGPALYKQLPSFVTVRLYLYHFNQAAISQAALVGFSCNWDVSWVSSATEPSACTARGGRHAEDKFFFVGGVEKTKWIIFLCNG